MVNNQPLYINGKSNHPYTVIKELPRMIKKDFQNNQEQFNQAKPLYEETLSERNYKVLLQFEKAQYNTNRNRLRKVIWFNSSFTQNVKTNIGKVVKQHFPKHYILKKIVNKNTFKLSYCSMKNMSSIIKQHNVKILSTVSNEKRSCNFRNKECCPLKWYCLKGASYLKLRVKQIIILNYVLVHAKENINPVFMTPHEIILRRW